jgi:hypothetical protein
MGEAFVHSDSVRWYLGTMYNTSRSDDVYLMPVDAIPRKRQ